MQLTLQTDYSLRLLIHLSLVPEKRVAMGEVADAFGISRNHLAKVAQLLRELGYVDAVRGHSGGLRLAKDPAEIRIGAVVRRTEPDLRLVECFDDKTNTCPIAPACLLAEAIDEALEAFLVTLDRFTLADLVRNRRSLSKLLQITLPADARDR